VLRGHALQAAAHWGNVLLRLPGRYRDLRGRTASPVVSHTGPSRRVRHSNTR